MLVKKTLAYLLARGLPGIIGLLAIMVYTRLLSPEIYGQYAIVMSLVILTITLCFQWLQFATLRFYPKQQYNEEKILSNVSITFLFLAIIVLPFFALLLSYFLDFLTPLLVFIVVLLTFLHALFDTAIQFSICKGKAFSYGLLLFLKSSLGLLLGISFFYYGLQLAAPISGLLGAYSLLALYFIIRYYKKISWDILDITLIKSMMHYGIPLSGTFLMNYIMANSDRIMLAWLIDEKSAGLYSAAYDLSNFSFIIMLMAIHLAIYPMLVKAYENKDNKQTQLLLEQNLITLLLFSILPGVLFSLLVVDFTQLILGQAFWETAVQVIPVVALATFFLGLKAYYFDLAFLLTHKTRQLLTIGIFGGGLNILLNYFFINQWEIMGAAYATCLSYFFILCLSYWKGKKLLDIPIAKANLFKILLLSLLCCLSIYFNQVLFIDNFFINILILIVVYLSISYYFNFLDCRLIFKGLILFLGRKFHAM